MKIKKINYLKYIIPFQAVALFAWLHQVYVTRTHPDAVYMDSLRLVYQLEQWRRGHLPFLNLWGRGAEHQGFINPFFLLLNVKYFSFNVVLANRLTGIVVALVALVILVNFNSKIRKSEKEFPGALLISRSAISILISALCFSWAGFEIFTLDLGLPLWVKNLSFVTYFAVHAYYLTMPIHGKRTWAIGLGLSLAGPVIVLMIGMGWSYSFVTAVLAVNSLTIIDSIRRRDLRASLSKSLPAITLLLAQLVYLIASIGVGGAETHHKEFSTLQRIPELTLYALGSGLIGVETIVNYPDLLRVLQYISGSALAVAIVLVFVRCRHQLYREMLLPIYLIAYGFLTALSVSIARGSQGAMAVMASRYYMDIMFFYVGLIWIWYDSLERPPAEKQHVSRFLFIALCIVVVIGQGLTYKREWAAAPYRAIVFNSMNQALLQGVQDQKAANLLQSPLDNARKGDRVLQKHHLALYSSFPLDACKADRVHYLSGWYSSEAQGIWMGRAAVMQIPACRCDFVASIYLPTGFSARTMTISDSKSTQAIDLVAGKVRQVWLPPSLATRTLDITVTKTTIPSELFHGTHDMRSLGALWINNDKFACDRHSFSSSR